MLTIKYFSTKWCGPCKAFSPVFDQVMSETKTNYQKIDAEVMNEAVQQYNITSVPTLVFEKDGSVIHRHTGVMSRGQLTNIINSL